LDVGWDGAMKEGFFFGAGATGDDEGACEIDAEVGGERRGGGDGVLDLDGVPLHAAGDVEFGGVDAQVLEAGGVVGVLDGGEVEGAEHGGDEAAEFAVAAEGAGAEAAVDDGDGELAFRQQLWGDAVYVRDFTRLAELSPERLLKYAAIVHDVYQSYDLAHKALMEYDRRRGSGLAGAYFELVRAAGASAGVMISRG
jgi:hypothetical protein